MRFHLIARNVEGRHLMSLGSFTSREQAVRAAKWLRKYLPPRFMFSIGVEEEREARA